LITHPTDAVVSPATAVAVGGLGGLGVLNAEGLWARHANVEEALAKVQQAAEDADLTALTRVLQELHAAPIQPELIAESIKKVTTAGVTVDPCLWFLLTEKQDDAEPGGLANNQHHQGTDWIYGGWDRDVMQADVAQNGPNPGDRLIDWNGAFNLYTHCNAAYGGFNDERENGWWTHKQVREAHGATFPRERPTGATARGGGQG